MGSSQSHMYDLVSKTYDNYYPKSRYLRPKNLSTVLMVSSIGTQIFVHNKQKRSDHALSFILLASTGANVGLQTWIMFVSGMTMIRLLPRHQFSLVQSHLFPKYFFLNSFFSFASFFAFLGLNPVGTWKDEICLLGYLLGGSFVLNALNFAIFNPKTIEYSSRMRELEKLTGDDQLNVVGKLSSESKIENDPAYKKAKKSFLIYHGVAVTTNLISLVSNIAQLYILSGKAHFSP